MHTCVRAVLCGVFVCVRETCASVCACVCVCVRASVCKGDLSVCVHVCVCVRETFECVSVCVWGRLVCERDL